mmetsp:Transcript_32647/g.96039  ORF Transcript_32647/g.96039 Transcript_32647/m.96039 type:complete len:209 (+) Transcript_32647:62-688(+)
MDTARCTTAGQDGADRAGRRVCGRPDGVVVGAGQGWRRRCVVERESARHLGGPARDRGTRTESVHVGAPLMTGRVHSAPQGHKVICQASGPAPSPLPERIGRKWGFRVSTPCEGSTGFCVSVRVMLVDDREARGRTHAMDSAHTPLSPESRDRKGGQAGSVLFLSIAHRFRPHGPCDHGLSALVLSSGCCPVCVGDLCSWTGHVWRCA